jgi:uncharacterized membrane protein
MIKLINELLRKNRIRCDYNTLNKKIISHPFYPSLNSVTDTLDEFEIHYTAFVSDKSDLSILKYPILLFVSNNELNDFVLVENQNQLESDKLLFESWNGVALMIDNNKKYATNMNNGIVEWKYLLILSLAIIFMFFVHMFSISLIFSLFIILGFFGIYLCLQIINYNLGLDTSFLNKICSINTTDKCSSVLNSNYSKLTKNYGLADIGLSYFITIVLFSIIAILSKIHFFSTLYILVFSSVILTLISIYIQFFILKSICKLCLGIVFINWTQFFLLLINDKSNHAFSFIYFFNINIILILFFAFFISILLSFLIKSVLKSRATNNNLEIQILKWERNPILFINHLQSQKSINDEIWDNDLIIGNKIALIRLIIVINPFCVPCGESIKQIEELYKLHSDNLCIIFRVLSNSKDILDPRRVALNYIFNAHENGNNLINILSSWFNNFDLDHFKNTYLSQYDIKNFTKCISMNHNWCKHIGIQYTPTYFLNGFELTTPYDLSSLTNQINYYLEHLTLVKVVRNT